MSQSPSQIEVRVLLFGLAASNAASPSVTVTLENGATVSELLGAMALQHAAIRSEVDAGRIAVDHAFAPPTTVVTPDQELALISMVSGG